MPRRAACASSTPPRRFARANRAFQTSEFAIQPRKIEIRKGPKGKRGIRNWRNGRRNCNVRSAPIGRLTAARGLPPRTLKPSQRCSTYTRLRRQWHSPAQPPRATHSPPAFGRHPEERSDEGSLLGLESSRSETLVHSLCRSVPTRSELRVV
jgi:hypothetical protein